MPQVGANQGFRTTRSADGTFHPVHLITDGSTEGEAGLMISPGQQMLDLSAITSGIAAIRQSQATIVGDLKALQASNEHLWREALESRERQTKHEETIDLIVSFLERLFGTEGAGLKGLKEAMRRGGIARTTSDGVYEEPASAKKRRKLGLDRMISDAPNQEGDDGQIVELPSGKLGGDSLNVVADSPGRIVHSSRKRNILPTSHKETITNSYEFRASIRYD